MCWNDFVDVDFTGACLAECDLRASTFTDCTFSDADLGGVILARDQELDLTSAQRKVVVLDDDEPAGG